MSDPADRRGVVAALITLGALAGSTALGGVAGLLGAAIVGASAPNDGLVATGLGVGAALLGGTSAFGRRGGIFGTVFAVGLLAVTMAWVDATGRNWSDLGFAAVAIGVGLLVSRMVERFGRPRSEEDDVEDDDWVPNSQQAPVEAWTPSQPSWQTNSQQTPTAERTWGGEGAWGTADRR